MKFFNRLKVRSKITSGFALILVLTLGVGVISITRLNGLARQSRMVDELLKSYSNRTEIRHLVVSWGYPVFRESESLVTYLQSENDEEQQQLYKRFQQNGREFNRIADSITSSGTSSEEVERIGAIKEMQRGALKSAVQLIAIRDHEGDYGEKTRAGLASFQESIRKFIEAIKELENLEEKGMEKIEEESIAITTGVRESVKTTILVMMVISFLALFIGGALVFIFSRIIVKPILKTLEVARKVANGDLTESHIEVSSHDEIGEMLHAINEMTINLRSIFRDVKDTSFALASASEEMSVSSIEIARGAEVQSKMASQVSSASQQMSASVVQVAQNAEGVSVAAREAEQLATQGKNSVSRTIDSMNGIAITTQESRRAIESLGERSSAIEKIIMVIEEIADQTNLLALNAAIEAARAGEQGRGFAVVADEVRNLAEKTTHATQEINAMVQAIQSEAKNSLVSMEREVHAVEEGVSLTKDAGTALQMIVAQVMKVTVMVQEIAVAAAEQTTVADQISHNIVTVAEISSDASDGSKEIAQAGEEIAKFGSNLQNIVENFRVDIEEDFPDTGELDILGGSKKYDSAG